MRYFLLPCALLTLASCASIVEGSSQDLKIQTSPSQQARCDVTNERGKWMALAPGNVTIKRSQSRLHVECANQQFIGKADSQAGAEDWALGNILIGGVIGIIVDSATGSLFAYDDNVHVPMVQRQASVSAPSPAPSAVQPLQGNPLPFQVDPTPRATLPPSSVPSQPNQMQYLRLPPPPPRY